MQQQNRNNPRSNRNQAQAKQPKFNRQGKLALTIDQLRQLVVNLPPGFAEAGMSLVINIKATGTEIGMTPNPPQLQPLEDLNRLFAAKRTISGIEAQEKKSSNLSLQKGSLMRLVMQDKLTDLSKVPQKYGAEVTRLHAHNEFLDSHLAVIKSVQESGRNGILKPFLLNQVNLIKRSFDDYIQAMVVGSDNSHKDLLRTLGVSEWLYNKLTASTVSITSTMNLEDFFFPKKGEKGLYLTVKEWRETTLLVVNQPLLTRSHPLIALINDDSLVIPMYTQTELNGLKDETNNEVKKILRQTVYVIPTTDLKEYAIAHPTILKPQGEQNLMTLFQVELFSLLTGSFPLDMAPKESIRAFFGIDAVATPTSTLREDFLKKLKEGSKSILDNPDALQDFFNRRSDRYPSLKKLKFEAPKDVEMLGNRNIEIKDSMLLHPLSLEEKQRINDPKFGKQLDALNARFTMRVRKTRDITSKSRLSQEAKDLISDLEKDSDYTFLIAGIITYLTSFSNLEMQKSAARIMHAEYAKKSILLDEETLDEENEDEEVIVPPF